MIETTELLRYARDAVLTGPDKWHQGGMQSPDGQRFCVMGAIEQAAVLTDLTWADAIPATRAVHETIVRRDPWWGVGIKCGTAKFNDDPSTEFPDVISLLDETIKTLEALDRKDNK